MTAWPAVVWRAPVLRGLDASGRDAIAHAGRLVEHGAAATIYREGAPGDSLFVVVDGAVELRAVRRGDDAASVVRVARAGGSFGEEAYLPGLSRRGTATAAEPTRIAEIPIAVLSRAVARASGDAAEREQRYLERTAARDLLACSAFARELAAADLDALVDAARVVRTPRGERVYEAGAAAEHVYFVVDGLVQLLGDDDRVTAYLARGDFFGDQEALAGSPRRSAAVAAGDSWCAAVPRDTWRALADRHPGVLPRLRRVADAQAAAQREVVDAAEARSTRHVFRDLYRMQMARSLLVIEQDACVRCGHCAWSCEQVHGVARLVRRGDKVVTQLASGAATLLLPNTCQHCRHAACMIDCPTGAIGRDPEGEVFIRPSLCTGCGNCAKACPWENIQMAPRPAPAKGTSRLAVSAEIAVKCDLCHGYDAPACVEACPTGAVLRIDPARDVAEVARVFGLAPGLANATVPASARVVTGGPQAARPAAARPGMLASTPIALASAWTALAIVVTAAAGAAHRARAWTPAHGIGRLAGIVAALLVVALAAYVVPKRLARSRKRERADRLVADERPLPRSRTRRHLAVHLGLGVLLPAAMLAHAGVRAGASSGGALAAVLAATVVLGALAAGCYRVLPRVLTRLERRGTLPEDLAGEAEALQARLYRAVSGKGDREKALADHVLIPYAGATLGWLRLATSGRGLADEERRLRARVDAIVAGRRLDGVDELIRIAVELRALPARRALERLLRAWPPLHVVAGAMALALLVAHVVLA